MSSDEILIHTSYPTTKADDDRIRRLASSAALFEVANIVDLTNLNGEVEQSLPYVASGSQDTFHYDAEDQQYDQMQSSQSIQETQSSLGWSSSDDEYINDTLLAAQALESQLLTASLRQEQRELDQQRALVGIMPPSSSQQSTPRASQGTIVAASRASGAPSPHSAGTSQQSEPTAEQVAKFAQLSLEIIPPEAPVNNKEGPIDSSSPLLDHIADNVAASRHRYQPSRQSREIEREERGHWLFDTKNWKADDQLRFWRSMEQTVGAGKAGWGVTCFREPGKKVGLGNVQVFCWGQVVRHIWLLLWVLSRGDICACGAKWIDCSGETVVEMDPS